MNEKDDPKAHEARVQGAFDGLSTALGDRLDPAARGTVEDLRKAMLLKDVEGVRQHMTQVKETHGWLYRELAAHPEIANILNELALSGF